MLLDFILIAFLVFLSYCLYIVVIIPYQEKRRKELLKLDDYLSKLEETKQVVADKMSINDLK